MKAILPLLSLTLASAAWAAEEPLRVLVETGFEEGLEPLQRAWGDDVAITMDTAHGGNACLRIVNGGSAVLPEVEYGPGQRFHFEFWMKVDHLERGPEPWNKAGAQVLYRYAPEGGGHFDICLTQGTTDWTRHEATIAWDGKKLPARFTIALHVWNATGTAYFDDVKLVELPPAQPDPRVPPREQVEDQPPRVWPLPPVAAGPPKVGNGVLEVAFSEQGLPAAIRLVDEEEPLVGALSFLAQVNGQTLAPDTLVPQINGYDVDRGWMTRCRAVLVPALDSPLPTANQSEIRNPKSEIGEEGWPRVEVFTEYFKASPLVAIFVRLWLANGSTVRDARIELTLPGQLSTAAGFAGNTLQQTPRTPPLEKGGPGGGSLMHLGPHTTKPFLALRTDGDGRGVLIYHPLPPELRRWYVDDYVPERLEVEVQADGDKLSYRFPSVTAGYDGYCHSLDLTLFVQPYRGTLAEALKPYQIGDRNLLEDEPPFTDKDFQGFWDWPVPQRVRGLRVTRYHPWETFASCDASEDTFTYGHDGGFGWGWVNVPQKQMRFSALSENPLWRDSCLRMLSFFLLRRDAAGTPPHLNMYKPWALNVERIEDFYHRHFCQDIEFRVGEWRELLTQAKYLSDAEREDIYTELQAIRAIFDPARKGVTWTSTVEGGGYWFDYMNVDIRGGLKYILNSHATSLGNVGELMLLSRDLGQEEDFAAWREIFARGVEGLLWVLGQEEMWCGGPQGHDPNEVKYGLKEGGPQGYHLYLVSSWLPRVLRASHALGGYRLDELVHYQQRLMQARFLQGQEDILNLGREALREVGAEGDTETR
jgi:hypothetical protein